MNGKAIHQGIDEIAGLVLGTGGEVDIARVGEDGTVAEDLLHLQQICARFDQVSGVGMSKAVGTDLLCDQALLVEEDRGLR